MNPSTAGKNFRTNRSVWKTLSVEAGVFFGNPRAHWSSESMNRALQRKMRQESR